LDESRFFLALDSVGVTFVLFYIDSCKQTLHSIHLL
jgi:hypothetical protein